MSLHLSLKIQHHPLVGEDCMRAKSHLTFPNHRWSFLFPGSVLEPTILQRRYGYFYWRIELETKIWVPSVQFSFSVMPNTLRPHESQHTRPPCPSPTPGAHSDSRPSSPWCHPVISSSVVPFSSCPQSLPASGSFPMSQLWHEGDKVLEFQL